MIDARQGLTQCWRARRFAGLPRRLASPCYAASLGPTGPDRRPSRMRRLRPLLSNAAGAAVFVLAHLPGAPPAAAAPVTVAPPALAVREHRLANGLEVLLLEDHTVPVASVQLWYHVGAKNEPPG